MVKTDRNSAEDPPGAVCTAGLIYNDFGCNVCSMYVQKKQKTLFKKHVIIIKLCIIYYANFPTPC